MKLSCLSLGPGSMYSFTRGIYNQRSGAATQPLDVGRRARVPAVYPLLSLSRVAERFPESGNSCSEPFEQLLFRTRETIAGRRKLFEQTPQGAFKEFEILRSLRHECDDFRGVRRRESVPRCLTKVEHFRRNRPSLVVQRGKSLGRKIPQIAGERDVVDGRPLCCIQSRRTASDRVKYLDQLQLVIQIPLEPENDALEFRQSLEQGVAGDEVLCELVELCCARRGEVCRADAAQLGQREIPGNRPIVKNV